MRLLKTSLINPFQNIFFLALFMSILQNSSFKSSKPSTGRLGGCDGVHKGSGIFCWRNTLAASVFGAMPRHLGMHPPPWKDKLIGCLDDGMDPLYVEAIFFFFKCHQEDDASAESLYSSKQPMFLMHVFETHIVSAFYGLLYVMLRFYVQSIK